MKRSFKKGRRSFGKRRGRKSFGKKGRGKRLSRKYTVQRGGGRM